MGILKSYFKVNLLYRILIGLALGIPAGLFLGESISWVEPLGTIFIRLLKMIVMPVVLTSLVLGAASVTPQQLGRVGVKAFLFYLISTGFAVSIGLIIGNLVHPGSSLNLAATASIGGGEAIKEIAAPSLMDTFITIVPTNPFQSIVEGHMLSMIFFAMVFGIGLAHLRQSDNEELSKSANTLFGLINVTAEIIYKIVSWILEFAPIGVFALIAGVFTKNGVSTLGPLMVTIATVFGAMITHMVLVYGGALSIWKINPIKFFAKMKTVLVTSFVTRSSSGTLPVSMEAADEEMGVSKGIYSFSLPLGATINMDGTAIYQGVVALFIGFAIGAPLTFDQQITIIITSVLASIGTAGVPGAGVMMLAMVLDSIGVKLVPGSAVAMAYAMIFGIDAILDMGRTMVNVTGDMTVTALIAKSEGKMDMTKWE